MSKLTILMISLSIILATLKATNIVEMSWWDVLTPMWFGFLLRFFWLFIFGFIEGVNGTLKEKFNNE